METNGMSLALSDAWRRLEVGAPPGDSLFARIAIPELSQRLQCGIDAARKRHLLIQVGDIDGDFHDARSRGLICRTRELVVHGGSPSRYLDIECKDAGGHAIFDVLAVDLAAELAKPDARPVDSVGRVLGRWRRFWSHPYLSLLTREQQFGLFAELWFLNIWLLPRVGPFESVSRWHGPTGALHDFSWKRTAVEVKATMSSRGRIFRINGLDQLIPPTDGHLALLGMRLQEDSGATNSLPALVSHVRTALSSNPEALDHFETSLALTGYSIAHEPEYDKLRVIVREERLFLVSGDFPRLTPTELSPGISPAIERIEYEINLNLFDHLSIAEEGDITKFLSN